VRYLTVDEVAKDLGLTKRSVQRYCKLGLMPAEQIWVKNNSSYQIPSHQYYRWKVNQKANDKDNFRVTTPKSTDDLSDDIENLIIDWLDWCKTGKLGGLDYNSICLSILVCALTLLKIQYAYFSAFLRY